MNILITDLGADRTEKRFRIDYGTCGQLQHANTELEAVCYANGLMDGWNAVLAGMSKCHGVEHSRG